MQQATAAAAAATTSSSLSAAPFVPPGQPEQAPDIYTQQVELRRLTNSILDEMDRMRKVVDRSQDRALADAYGMHVRRVCELLLKQLDVLFALQDQQSRIVAAVVAEVDVAHSTTVSAAVAALIEDRQRVAQEEQQQQQSAQRSRKLNRK